MVEWVWTNLGKPFAVKLYTESIAFQNQPNYLSDDYRDRDLYVAESEVEYELGGLINDLKSDLLLEWSGDVKDFKMVKEEKSDWPYGLEKSWFVHIT